MRKLNFRLNVRIGTKLALTAGAGVALVLIMVGNEFRVARLTASMDAQVQASRTVLQSVLEIGNGQNRAALQNRTMQNAESADEVDEALRNLADLEANGSQAFDRALQAATDEVRPNLQKARELYNNYIATMRDYAAVQKDYIAARDLQSKMDADWPATFDPVINSLAVAAAGNRVEFIHTLQEGDAAFKQGRLLFWSYLVHASDDLLKRMNDSFSEAQRLFKEARGMTLDKETIAGIDRLVGFIPTYKTAIDKTLQALHRRDALMRDRADPIRQQADELFDVVKMTASAWANERDSLSDAEQTHARQLTLLIGIFVVIVLVGSAVFLAISVGKPIRRIGEVLLALAQGDKGVEIPYAGRGDEVGDAARAARTFKDNLLR
ncbi:MAG TPA: HAMP domain-containing protein, partial [Xanthobacteraceae bacterium]|nr:HAMP domain-containing protein [Xanthobacteraceae bacterium]